MSVPAWVRGGRSSPHVPVTDPLDGHHRAPSVAAAAGVVPAARATSAAGTASSAPRASLPNVNMRASSYWPAVTVTPEPTVRAVPTRSTRLPVDVTTRAVPPPLT